MACIKEAVASFLHKAQKGSIHGRRGAEHIRKLNEDFYSAVENELSQNLHVLFMDTKKAFDSIHHKFIYEALQSFGFPMWVINVIT